MNKPEQVELHSASLVKCTCGQEIVVRWIEEEPTRWECSKCGKYYKVEEIEEQTPVWTFDCNECGLEQLVEIGQGYDEQGFYVELPAIAECSGCGTQYDVSAI